jgi:Asp-tRNA(Asn)/Glu-tRNA(Gln) amidotransferase A subunit family amidase
MIMNFGKYSQLLLGLLIGVLTAGSFFYIYDRSVTTKTIAEAEKIIGLEFTEAQRERIVQNLNNNVPFYEAMRALEMPNDTPFPLYFDPTPPGKQYNFDPQIEINWDIPANVDLPENRVDLAFYTVAELSALIRDRKITSLELTQFFLDRLKKHDSKLESVVTLTEERALEQAALMDQELANGKYRGPLHGIPYGAKDLFAVEGYKTTWGAMPYKDQVIDETATVIKKLDEAGAVLIAKMTLGALAYGDIWFGGRTNNPWNLEQGSSGSSAGSASATAAGLLPFALGTETLGSIVSPATRNGATGLRPTFGRVSRHGAMALSWTMDKVGPLTRSVEDAAIVFDAIRGHDHMDHTVKDLPFNYVKDIDLNELRIGYYKSAFEQNYGTVSFDSTSLEVMRSLGAELIPIELPSLPLGGMFNLLTAEAAAAFDELTLTGRDSLMVWQANNAWPNSFRAVRFVPAVEWIQMNRVRGELIIQMDKALKDVDMYISPSFVGGNLLITNLTGHPSVVLPNGFTESGQPVSITFMGHLYDEATVLAVAKKYQEATGFHKKHPPLFMHE